MPRFYGNALPAGIGGEGIDVPTEPRPVSAEQIAQREARQVAAIVAAEAAASAPPTKPQARRRRQTDTFWLPPALPQAPAPPSAAHRRAEDSDSGEARMQQLETDLALASERIAQLLARVDEQARVITLSIADVDAATARAVQADQVVAELVTRIAKAESDLEAAHRRIEALLAERADDLPEEVVEPVICEGGCGLPVDPDYVRRTHRRWHGPCSHRVPTLANAKAVAA